MAKVVTLGEIMLRLSPPTYTRLVQATSFDINYGGGEANVAASLAQLGHQVSFVSKIPSNAIGDAAVGSLRKLGIDCSHVVRGGDRLGIYFLETGASVRPSGVIYDRRSSAVSMADPSEFDFDSIFRGADLFHVSGITPVLSEQAASLTLEALKQAKAHGALVSFDLNYRAKLWADDVERKQERMREMMSYVDICFGNGRDAARCLGYSCPDCDLLNGDFDVCVDEIHMRRLLRHFDFKYLVTSLRHSSSASENGWSALVCSEDTFYKGRDYTLHIVDRVGAGDSFAAGFLHGFLSRMRVEQALEFAIAAAAIKHTIPGDVNYASEEEVLSLMYSDGSGRIQR